MCVYDLATQCARGLQVIFATSGNQRAQGMPDARCTRGPVRNGSQDCAHEHTGQPVGWVEPLRNPSHVAIAAMGFASTFARSSFSGHGRSNPSYELIPHRSNARDSFGPTRDPHATV